MAKNKTNRVPKDIKSSDTCSSNKNQQHDDIYQQSQQDTDIKAKKSKTINRNRDNSKLSRYKERLLGSLLKNTPYFMMRRIQQDISQEQAIFKNAELSFFQFIQTQTEIQNKPFSMDNQKDISLQNQQKLINLAANVMSYSDEQKMLMNKPKLMSHNILPAGYRLKQIMINAAHSAENVAQKIFNGESFTVENGEVNVDSSELVRDLSPSKISNANKRVLFSLFLLTIICCTMITTFDGDTSAQRILLQVSPQTTQYGSNTVQNIVIEPLVHFPTVSLQKSQNLLVQPDSASNNKNLIFTLIFFILLLILVCATCIKSQIGTVKQYIKEKYYLINKLIKRKNQVQCCI